MSKQDKIKQVKSISGFVKSVAEKDYATANKHLTDTINEKLRVKIAELKKHKIFNTK